MAVLTVHDFTLDLKFVDRLPIREGIYWGAVFRDRLGYFLKKRFCIHVGSEQINSANECERRCHNYVGCPVMSYFGELPENYSQPYVFAFSQFDNDVWPIKFRVFDDGGGAADKFYGYLREALNCDRESGFWGRGSCFELINESVIVKDWQIAIVESKPWSDEYLTMEFITPFRLKKQGGVCKELTGENILVALLNRLGRLSRNWAGGDLPVDFMELKAAAKQIEVDACVQWETVGTRSPKNSPGRSICFSGYRGKIILKGDLAAWKPLLYLGQWTHLGREAVFGMGRYRMEN